MLELRFFSNSLMKISYHWLKDFLQTDKSPAIISQILTEMGLEVEATYSQVPPFNGVVVAEVLSISPHPNADHLQLANVTDGFQEYQVVCKATNCRPSLRTAFAKIGATLLDEKGKSFTIKPATLRGVESFGMLCALDELGLEEKSEGIVELDSSYKVGEDLKEILSDTLFEISLTPNLGHCLSVLGVAREIAAKLNIKVNLPSIEEFPVSKTGDFQVKVSCPEVCPLYLAAVIEDIEMGPTPLWMRQRLEYSGYRSINLFVDIGNYVMLELGQPLHFFDKDRLEGSQLKVTLSHSPVEELDLLSGSKASIPPGSLVIEDAKGPVALAGISGVQRASVHSATRNIVIEAALFDPSTIRKTAKALQIRSESSYRFERGIDPEGVKRALNRAISLMKKLGKKGKVKSVIECRAKTFFPRAITLRPKRVGKLLGIPLTPNEIVELLSRLEIPVVLVSDDRLEATIPSYRNDLQIEVDLIEEVGRLYGFDSIQKASSFTVSTLKEAPLYTLAEAMRNHLMEEGLQEWITCDLISPFLSSLTEEITLPKESVIHVLHPSSLDQSVLRLSLLPGLLSSVKHNLNMKNPNMRAFEIGKIHFRLKDQFYEHHSLGIILSGLQRPYHFDPKPSEVDFLDLKGILENILELSRILDITFETSHYRSFHPYRQAKMVYKDTVLGVLGEVHPEKLAALDIRKRVFYAELNLSDLMTLEKEELKVEELPIYPESERDWTLTLSQDISLKSVYQSIQKVDSSILGCVELLDIYRDQEKGSLFKNVTLRLHYRDLNKTLSNEEIEKEHTRITQEVAKNFA